MKDDLIRVEIINESTRLDQALLESLRKESLRKQTPIISRNQLKSWFQERKIHLAGRPVKPALLLPPGSYEIQLCNIQFRIHDDAAGIQGGIQGGSQGSSRVNTRATPSNHPEQIQIVYEDHQLLILNKTSGMPSVPHHTDEAETAVGLALAHCPGLAGIGRNDLEPGILHRLDTGTSGMLVFAKSQTEFERLSTAWKNREVEKTYRAWVCRSGSRIKSRTDSKTGAKTTPKMDIMELQLPYRMDTPLAHDAKSSKRMLAWSESSRNAIRGKPLSAVTHLVSLHSTSNKNAFDLEIQIETGVMHQIRCHLASIDYPIVGDPIYKGLTSSRLWLHAWRLVLPGFDGKLLKFEAELPPGWEQLGDDHSR